MFCNKCGKEINNEAIVCIGCGCAVNNASFEKTDKGLITILLCCFLGYLGAHRFYTGHTVIAVVQLLTLGGCFIWWLIDFIIILTGDFKDAQGNSVKIRM